MNISNIEKYIEKIKSEKKTSTFNNEVKKSSGNAAKSAEEITKAKIEEIKKESSIESHLGKTTITSGIDVEKQYSEQSGKKIEDVSYTNSSKSSDSRNQFYNNTEKIVNDKGSKSSFSFDIEKIKAEKLGVSFQNEKNSSTKIKYEVRFVDNYGSEKTTSKSYENTISTSSKDDGENGNIKTQGVDASNSYKNSSEISIQNAEIASKNASEINNIISQEDKNSSEFSSNLASDSKSQTNIARQTEDYYEYGKKETEYTGAVDSNGNPNGKADENFKYENNVTIPFINKTINLESTFDTKIASGTYRIPAISWSDTFTSWKGFTSFLNNAVSGSQSQKVNEEVLYKRGVEQSEYYPYGSYEEIEKAQLNGIDVTSQSVKNISNSSDGWTIALNLLQVANSALDVIMIDGPSFNMKNDWNDMRYDLRLKGEKLPENEKMPEATWKQRAKEQPNKEETSEKVEHEPSFDEKQKSGFNFIDQTDKQPEKMPEATWKQRAKKQPEKQEGPDFSDSKKQPEKQEGSDFSDSKEQPNKDETSEKVEHEPSFDEKQKSGFNFIDQTDKEVEKQEGANWIIQAKEQPSKTVFSYGSEINEKEERELPIVGNIYVTPPLSGITTTNPFIIPLQNNLKFQAASRAATYNALQFFGRIGDVKQYSRTDSLQAIQLTTEYFVEKDDENGSGYSLRDLQNIEMKYRSLVLPGETTAKYINASANSFQYFTRPPLINIVLGDNAANAGNEIIITKANANNYYANLFTEVVPTSANFNSFRLRYKNFAVANVSIDKDTEKFNYAVKDKNYKDTMGFVVELEIIEIDQDYMGSMPSFNTYYKILYEQENAMANNNTTTFRDNTPM